MMGKAPNGMAMTFTIENNSKLFKTYKAMGFDIFEKKVKSESTKGDSK